MIRTGTASASARARLIELLRDKSSYRQAGRALQAMGVDVAAEVGPAFLWVGLAMIPLFLAFDLAAVVPEYHFRLRCQRESLCAHCGRLVLDTSHDRLEARDQALGQGQVVRSHGLRHVAGARVCPGCSHSLAPDEVSPLDLAEWHQELLGSRGRVEEARHPR